MFTMNFFDSFTKLLSTRTARDCDLRSWAATEYKFDTDYAYNVMKKTGKAPEVGVRA